MGVFIIHSRGGLSSIPCSQMENTAISYQVLPTSIDPSYDERMKVIYSETAAGGSPAGVKTGLVKFKFRMFITGVDQAAVISNIATVTRLLTNLKGGYIEYRPVGLGDSVMETWYRFVRSGVPKMVRKEGLIDTIMERYNYNKEDQIDGTLIDCEVETFAWGTSDPYTPIAIKATEDVDNTYDDTHDNTFTVASSLVKGDAIIPIIKVTGNDIGGVLDIGILYIHKKQFPIGDGDHLDWKEAEDSSGGGWTDAADGSRSHGEYTHATGTILSTFGINWTSVTPNEQLAGKVVPVICLWTSDSSDKFTMYLQARHTGGHTWKDSDKLRIEALGVTAQVYNFSALDLPPVVIPDWVGATSWPSFADYFGGYFSFFCTGDAADDRINIDFFWFPVVDGGNYLAKLVTTTESIMAVIQDDKDTYLLIDATSGAAIVLATANDRVQDMWTVYGPPLTDMMIFKGYDTQFRLLGTGLTGGVYTHQIEFEYEVTVSGIYATVYPFQEA